MIACAFAKILLHGAPTALFCHLVVYVWIPFVGVSFDPTAALAKNYNDSKDVGRFWIRGQSTKG